MKATRPNLVKALKELGYEVATKHHTPNEQPEDTAVVGSRENFRAGHRETPSVRIFRNTNMKTATEYNEGHEKDANGFAWHYTPSALQASQDWARELAYKLRQKGFSATVERFEHAPVSGGTAWVNVEDGQEG